MKRNHSRTQDTDASAHRSSDLLVKTFEWSTPKPGRKIEPSLVPSTRWKNGWPSDGREIEAACCRSKDRRQDSAPTWYRWTMDRSRASERTLSSLHDGRLASEEHEFGASKIR